MRVLGILIALAGTLSAPISAQSMVYYYIVRLGFTTYRMCVAINDNVFM